MNTIIYHPNASELPEGFRFPQEYLNLVNQGETNIPDLGWWHMMCFEKNSIQEWIQILKQDYPNREFIPFAHCPHDAEMSCFDNKNMPKVYCINLLSKQGTGHVGLWNTFEQWLQDMIDQAEEEINFTIKYREEMKTKIKAADTEAKKP